MRKKQDMKKWLLSLSIMVFIGIPIGIVSIFASGEVYRPVTVTPSIAKVGENITITGDNFGQRGFVSAIEIVSDTVDVTDMAAYNFNMKSIYAGSPMDMNISNGRFSITTPLRDLRGYDIPDGNYRVGIWWMSDSDTATRLMVSDYTFIVFNNGQVNSGSSTTIQTPTPTPSPTPIPTTEMRIIQQPPQNPAINELRRSEPFDVVVEFIGKRNPGDKINITIADEQGAPIPSEGITFYRGLTATGANSYTNSFDVVITDGKAVFEDLVLNIKEGVTRDKITLRFMAWYSQGNPGAKEVTSSVISLDQGSLVISDSKLLFADSASTSEPLCSFPLPALNSSGLGGASTFKDGSITGLTATVSLTGSTSRLMLAGNATGTGKLALDGELVAQVVKPDGNALPPITINPSNASGPVEIIPEGFAAGNYSVEFTFKKKGSTFGVRDIYLVGFNGAKLVPYSTKEKYVIDVSLEMNGQAITAISMYQPFDVRVYAPAFVGSNPGLFLKENAGPEYSFNLQTGNNSNIQIAADGTAVIPDIYIYGNESYDRDTNQREQTLKLSAYFSTTASRSVEGEGTGLELKPSGVIHLNRLWNWELSSIARNIPSLSLDGRAISNWNDNRIITPAKPLEFGAWEWTFTAKEGTTITLSGDRYGKMPFKAKQDGTLQLIRQWKDQNNKLVTRDYNIKLSDVLSGDGYRYVLNFGGGSGEYPAGNYTARFSLSATEDKFGASSVYLKAEETDISDIQAVKSEELFDKFVLGNDTLEIPVGEEAAFPVVIKSTAFKMFGLTAHPDFDSEALEITKITGPDGMTASYYGLEDGQTAWLSVSPDSQDFEGLVTGDTYFTLWVKPKKPGVWTIVLSGNYGWSGNAKSMSMYGGVGSTLTVKAVGDSNYRAVDNGIYIPEGAFLSDGPYRMTLTGQGIQKAKSIQLQNLQGILFDLEIVDATKENVVVAEKAGLDTGLYKVIAKDGSGNLLKLEGNPEIVVPPAVPIFNVERIDREPQLPGMDSTHIWRVTNYGTTDGYAMVYFAIPWYAQKPVVGSLPEGSRVMMNTEGMTKVPYEFEDFEGKEKIKEFPESDLGWIIFVAVPIKAGEFVNIPITMNIPAIYMVYDNSPLAEGTRIYVTASISGAYSTDKWSQLEGASDTTLVQAADIKYVQNRLIPVTYMTKEQYQRYIAKLKVSYPRLYKLLITDEMLVPWLYYGR